jgi:hypothetical protein
VTRRGDRISDDAIRRGETRTMVAVSVGRERRGRKGDGATRGDETLIATRLETMRFGETKTEMIVRFGRNEMKAAARLQ